MSNFDFLYLNQGEIRFLTPNGQVSVHVVAGGMVYTTTLQFEGGWLDSAVKYLRRKVKFHGVSIDTLQNQHDQTARLQAEMMGTLYRSIAQDQMDELMDEINERKQ